jgi:methylmalonyl-CoA mutase
MSSKNLLSEFESLSTLEWKQKIEKFLKGKPYDSIVHKIDEDLEIQPFYRIEDSFSEQPVLSDNQWLITESFNVGNAPETNKVILNALENGVNSLNLLFNDNTIDSITSILDNVYLSMIELNVSGDALEQNPELWLNAISKLEGIESCKGSFSFSVNNGQVLDLIHKLPLKLKKWSIFNIHIDLRSKSLTENLSDALTEVCSCFDALLKLGLETESVQSKVKFTIQSSDDYFLNIASIRALKKLWLGILEGYEFKNAIYPKIHAVTNPGLNDAYLNLIANTSQALSMAIAQVSSIEVRPSDSNNKDFSSRIARNVQNLLKLESHIDQVADPSAGSYYIENYSLAITKKVWKLILESRQ